MTPAEWIAFVGVAFTVTVGLIGGIVWLVRLEGRTGSVKSALDLVNASNQQAQALHTALALAQASIARIERDQVTAAAILERLARIEERLHGIERHYEADNRPGA